MNPRRVHALMRTHFPVVDAAQSDWINLVDEKGLLMEGRARAVLLEQFLERGVKTVLIEVHRRIGDEIPVDDVLVYLKNHVSRGNIRIADREFTVFAELAATGVGRCLQAPLP